MQRANFIGGNLSFWGKPTNLGTNMAAASRPNRLTDNDIGSSSASAVTGISLLIYIYFLFFICCSLLYTSISRDFKSIIFIFYHL